MRTMSKFFLIIAGIVTVAGVVICLIASSMAKNQNILLFPEKVDGKYVYTVDLNDTEISKISLDVTDAYITVHTGQENEYVEFINFNENYYSISTTNHVLSFDEYVDVESMLTFWDADYTFKGIRSILKLGNKIDGEKEINIYLSDDRDINILDFSVGNGTIDISQMSSETDYKFSLDNGSIKMTDISTVSTVSIKAIKCDIALEDCTFSNFNCDASEVTLKGAIGFCHNFTVNSKTGTVETDVGLDSDKYEVSVETQGTLSVNEQLYTGTYKNAAEELPEKHTLIKINGEQLNVSLSYKSLSDSTVIETE